MINNYGQNALHFYPFIRSTGHRNASITCVECRFESIAYNTWNGTHNKPLIHTLASIYLIRTSFIHIQTSVTSTFDYPPLIYCDAARLIRDAKRYFVFMESVFINVTDIKSIIDIDYSSTAYADRLPTIRIQQSIFKNVSVTKSIIYDETSSIAIIMNDASFDNIISGSIYFASLASASKDVRMDNVSVTSMTQLYKNNRKELFYFTGTDVTVTINALTVHYIYNTDASCTLSKSSPVVNTAMNRSCEVKQCSNPVGGIYAVGTVHMTNVEIDMDVVPPPADHNEGKCRQFLFYSGTDEKPMAFITNEGYMNISNMRIGRTMRHELIFNSNLLSVHNLSFDLLDTATYDPNSLSSYDIIKSLGEFNVLHVSNSHFYGSMRQIHAKGGIGTVSDSVFEQTGLSIWIDTCDQFTVVRSEMKNGGQFNGIVRKDSSLKDYINYPFRVWKSKHILFINNSISGFHPQGLLFIAYTENITMIGNEFNVDASQLFYKVAPKYLSFTSTTNAPCYIKYSSNIKLIGNLFDQNRVDPTQQWLTYYKNEGGVNCLSGNTFTNVAIYATLTNITSCFRPSLIDGVYNGSIPIDASLLGKMNHFLFDVHQNVPFVIKLSEVRIAFDQINITWINTTDSVILMENSDLLIVDSFISGDISYRNPLCNVLRNDRLSNDTEGVARLHIICGEEDSDTNYTWEQSLHSNRTRSVDHFSATKLNFSTESWSYYPGELLHFEYHITDILGHIINDYAMPKDGLVVQLHSNRFYTEFNIIHINTNAILLTDVSIIDNTGDEYDIDVNLAKNLFVAEYSMIALNITGCPMGYGPDSNNISCVICNTDSYNLIQNNVNRCGPCNPDYNSGIKCMDGTILVSEGHWVGFDGNHNIISSICPPSHCCTKTDKCDYEKKEELCALHRDPNSVLCSQCIEGYSESMNSINCVRCDTSYHLEYLLMPLLIAFACSVIVIRTDNLRKDEKEDAYLNPLLSRFRYIRIMTTIMITKCILYYEQAISEIVFKLTPLSHFASIFNLSVIANSFRTGGDCFINGLSAKQKILVDLMIPVAMITICALFYVVFLVLNRRSLIICCGRRRVNFGKMFLSLFTLTVGKVLDVLFKLLSCKVVGDRIVHFYFANETCFDTTWVVSFVCLFIIIFSFSAVFIQIHRMSPNQRQSPNHGTFIITSRYKPQYYLWEFVLFIRRILIALFTAFSHGIVMKLMFVGVITCFTALQHFYAPFLIHEANTMEAVLGHCLIFVILIQMFHLDEVFVSVTLSVLIVFPVPLMLWFILKVMAMRKSTWKRAIARKKKEQIADNSDTDDDGGVMAVANGEKRNAADIEMSEQTVMGVCDDCHSRKQCKIYKDGSFYCTECRVFDEDLYDDEY